MTEIVYLTFSILLAWALYRRPQRINIAIAIAFLLAVWASHYREHEALRAVLAAIYAGLSAVMVLLWRRYSSERAKIVGSIAVLQVTWAVLAGAVGATWNGYATAHNAACFVQVIVAGGFSDGFFAWLGRCAWRARSSGDFSLRLVGRK